ncbi:hypothetical protein SEA_ZETA1847_69 [Microbacterium phage Zeta1847]|uniref:Uncharacterized protein n=1 Tax=Microbacterium phage Zeta1847 TaxID=2201444 RepID=A0A2Z4QAS1_9CAUD|nr:hypothetical protein HOT46_gp69 [Microbacterium phage Zeta1847]AWY06703.1 hypothetical protein SEA_ZETA1847_69 [Microbacterium phage Zeta1847]
MSAAHLLAELEATEAALATLVPQAKELRRVANDRWAEVRHLTERKRELRAEAARLLASAA